MNEVHNRLTLSGSETEIKKLFDFIKDEGTNFDFNKIIAMPEILNINVSYGIIESAINAMQLDLNEYELKSLAILKDRNETPATFSTGDWALFLRCLENIRTTGSPNWHHWCNKNWGTKWNALESVNNKNTDVTLYFITAWSPVIELINELSKMFPELDFEYSFAGELNEFAESRKIKAGIPLEKFYIPEKHSKESFELFFELFPDCKEDYELTTDAYVWKDEEEDQA